MSDDNTKTIVVLDLETNNLPSLQFNTCAITELSFYAFSAKCINDREVDTKLVLKNINEDGVVGFDQKPPELPRVLHKLTLMINPRRCIHPNAELVTGLSNEMLKNESSFDRTTAECINNFLERLEKPICMVAHNGWSFDYPIIRYVYEKINMSMPSSLYCIDSYKAFRELDEKRQEIEKIKEIVNCIDAMENDNRNEFNKIHKQGEEAMQYIAAVDATSDPLEQSSHINWQCNNETTPKRKVKSMKRVFSESNTTSIGLDKTVDKREAFLSIRRSLFQHDFKPKRKFPEKGVYKLANIYKRCFNQSAVNPHRAESDVEILTKLILHYGLDFLAYVEERKQSFDLVPKLGTNTNQF